ncbi:hypothetical protein [Nonomuraea sp. NPDC002799]
MKYLTKKLLVALTTAALAGSGAAVGAALPASAAPLSASAAGGALFSGTGRGIDEDTALANAESAARAGALAHGFTLCDVFESVTSQDPKTRVFFAVVAVRCEDVHV